MWHACPCSVSGFDIPCHLLASKTSANKILLRFEKQLGSAWEHLAALTVVVRVRRAHTIGPGTAASATLSIWLSVPHPMLCRFCFCWQKLFSQCQKMSQSLQCKMIFFTSLTFPWQLAGFAGFTLRVKLLPEAPNSQTLKNQWARHSESSGISCFITYHTAYNRVLKERKQHTYTQTYPELQILYILEGWNFGELDNMSDCIKARSHQQRGYQLGAICGEEVANIPLIL